MLVSIVFIVHYFYYCFHQFIVIYSNEVNVRKGYKALILSFLIKHKIIKSINQSIEEVNFTYFLQIHNVVDLSVKIILCVSFIGFFLKAMRLILLFQSTYFGIKFLRLYGHSCCSVFQHHRSI